MPRRKWKGIRPGSKLLDVYNEGLLVTVFDRANLAALKASGADFEGGWAEDEADVDPELKKLARAGLFLAYELQQDDGVAVEVVVGPPLSKEELAVGRWYKPQRALLRLPSGKLEVHSANTNPLVDDAPDDKPGRAAVPPGDYVASLYRLDWEELRNDGIVSDGDDDEDGDGEERPWHGPQEVLVLTPAADARPVRGAKSYLRFPAKSDTVWKGKGKVVGDTFRGKAMTQYWWDYLHVNLDRAAERALGLGPGRVLRLTVADFVFDAVYAGDGWNLGLHPTGWAKALAAGRPEFGVAFRPGVPGGDDRVMIDRVVSTKPFRIHERWMPATVTLLDERHAVPPRPTSTELTPADIDSLLE